MNPTNFGSKRLSLRFNGDNHGLRYKTEFEDGNGIIENISGGGCSIKQLTVPLVVDEKILVIISFEEESDDIEIAAKVVRVSGEQIAVKFIDISEETKLKIIKNFAKKQRNNRDG